MIKEKRTISPWLSLMLSLIVGLIFGILTYQATKERWVSIVTGIAGTIFMEFILFKFYILQINTTINRLLRRDPLFLEEFDSLILNMEQVKKKYGTVLDFAREVVKEMISKHFVIVFRGPEEYRKNIERLSLSSKTSIEGTCTLRPKFFAQAVDITDSVEQRDERCRRLQYLKLILSAKVPTKCRIIILKKDEIRDIIKECCEAIQEIVDSGRGDKFNDIPEVEWFVTSANGNKYMDIGQPDEIGKQKIKLFWSEHTHAIQAENVNKLPKEEYKIENHRIEEFALFDRQVVIRYLKESNWSKGVLFMTWTGIPTVDTRYNLPFSLLVNEPTRPNDNIYSSFYDLVQSLWHSSLSVDTINFGNPLMQPINNKSPLDIYNQILKWLGQKRVIFRNDYKSMWVKL